MGTNVDGTGPQYDRIDEAMENAIKTFRNLYGERPFVVGEETTFAESDRFGEAQSSTGVPTTTTPAVATSYDVADKISAAATSNRSRKS